MKKAFRFLMAVILVAIATFGIAWIVTDGKIFYRGEATYDQSLTDAEKTFLNTIFTDETKLKNNVLISATDEQQPTSTEDSLTYDILVPVADFYYPKSNIKSDEIKSTPEVSLVSIKDLSPDKKMLSLDQNYYFDDFNSGAIFRTFHFDSRNKNEAITLVSPKINTPPFPENTLSFAQTGVTALSRGMNAKLNTVNDASFFADNIKDFLSSKDLTHTSNESSFSNYATANNICSNPKMLNALTAIGLDIVELTGNHNQDCGDEDAIATIDTYNTQNIQIFGGGKTAEDAAKPLKIDQKNAKITLLGYNLSTGGYTTDNTPGANLYSDEKFASDVQNAKENGDFIIVDIQYFECSTYDDPAENTTCDPATSVNGEQEFFRSLIEKGADIVIGTSAHQPQTYELYQGKPIYYGLGNLFFDQSWWPGTTRSLILTHYFIDGKYIQTRISPTVYDNNYQPTLMDEDASAWFIDRLNQAR